MPLIYKIFTPRFVVSLMFHNGRVIAASEAYRQIVGWHFQQVYEACEQLGWHIEQVRE